MEKTTRRIEASAAHTGRAWIAVGFAVVAIAAVMSNARAFTRAAGQSVTGAVLALPAQLAEPSDQVDWSKVKAANITPAESVASYDR